jgi:hypothetical protein
MSIWIHFDTQMIDTIFIFKIKNLDLDSILFQLKIISNEKVWSKKL